MARALKEGKKVWLNSKEEAVLSAFPESGIATLAELAGAAFNKRGSSSHTKGNSWVRNSVRKLLKLELVEQVPSKKGSTKSGTYKRTKKKIEDVVTKPKDTKAKAKAKETKETRKPKAA